MKAKLAIILIAAVAAISIGATKLVRNESTEFAKATTAKSTSAPVGGLMADSK